ncbi:poly(A) polymerase [Motilibacter peucedani]|uniref:Poly(A) polymerase n=1 Tax=Motilibacter peucedani TaxID=598650 RepID=A0A420XUP8_9ACTN|nr:CCA tRNA nucleotidyltransferase [Motilibacter peucedani]RKS80379.1 poly(A) polymerase [Motilibacter peucedani]
MPVAASSPPPPEPSDPSAVRRRAVAELLRATPVTEDLGRRFAAAGHELALVGGSVRDALLGRLGTDLDFTTDARPEQILALVRPWADAVWDVGIAFGTVGARKDGWDCEITTYRAEKYDRESRKPEVSFGDSLEDDLRRRDFRVNAMAVALPGTTFVDPFDGFADVAERILRTPGTPEESFDDDPLRMMRAARFASQIGFVPANDVVAAMTAMSDRLSIVSAERVQAELTKLLLGDRPRLGLGLMVETGLADQVLPELPALALEIDEHHRHKDVYEHTLTVLEQAIALEGSLPGGGPDLVLRLAALLHDIGKPRTRVFEADGGVSFHFHEVIGARMAKARLKALRYDKATIEDVSRLVELHLRFHGYAEGAWTDSAVRRYVRDAGPLLERLHALTRSDSTTRNKRKALALQVAYDSLVERIEALRAQEEVDAIRPDLDGTQIMEVLGVPPGPVVGKAYKHLLELRMDNGPMAHDDAVAALQEWWAAQQ